MSNGYPGGSDRVRHFLLLVVGAVEDHTGEASSFLDGLPWYTHHAASLGEARLYLQQDLARVVLCEQALPDGNWRDMLDVARSRRFPPPIIVTSRFADHYLWVEVLNLGGYDVLATPLEPSEALRSIRLAWQRWKTHYEDARPTEWARSAKR